MLVDRRASFEKLNYLLRPSKQVERKLLIHALHRMASLGYDVSTYTYLGFGSVYYADFILFHKYLYIDDMICVEAADIPKRMNFNKPFSFIRLRMKRVAELLPELDRTKKYLVWLDYDCGLSSELLRDAAGFLHVLAPGSIFLITVEAEARLPEDIESENQTYGQRVDRCIEEYREEFGRYVLGGIKRNVFSKSGLPKFLATVLRTHFTETLASRRGIEFLQLFNFRYADGAQMLSMGGLIDERQKARRVRRSNLFDLGFVHDNPEPLEICVPPLTVREKQWLDQKLTDELSTDSLEFELREEMLDDFRRYYRHYPTYYETLI